MAVAGVDVGEICLKPNVVELAELTNVCLIYRRD